MTDKRRIKRGCFICRCAFVDEIERLKRKRVKEKLIYEKFRTLIGYESSFLSFKQLLYKHMQHNNRYSDDLTRMALEKLGKETDIQALVDKLTILANRKVNEINPDEIKLSDVFAGQKVLIQIQKLKIAEDALSMMMAKMFGPKLKENITDGEIVSLPDKELEKEDEHTLLPAPAV